MPLRLRFLISGLLFPLLFGCKASYPPGTVEESIARLCEQEYGVDVQVKTHGRTIGALVVAKDLLLNDLSLSDQALNKIENVMLTTTRVTLSSEFIYEFFVVSLLDPDTGVQVSFVRYIKDIRRLIMDDISRNDYFQRMLIEVDVRNPVLGGVPPTFELKDYRLDDFLARQIAERIKLDFQINMVIQRLFQLGSLEGEFVPAASSHEQGMFRLTVFFLPHAVPFHGLGTMDLRRNFTKLLLQTAQTVTRRYEFKAFSGMDIVDQDGNLLAHYTSADFSRDSVNALMELIRSIKPKVKTKQVE